MMIQSIRVEEWTLTRIKTIHFSLFLEINRFSGHQAHRFWKIRSTKPDGISNISLESVSSNQYFRGKAS